MPILHVSNSGSSAQGWDRAPCVCLCCLDGWWPLWVARPTNYTKPPPRPTYFCRGYCFQITPLYCCPLSSRVLLLFPPVLSCCMCFPIPKSIAIWPLCYIMLLFSLALFFSSSYLFVRDDIITKAFFTSSMVKMLIVVATWFLFI